MQFTCMGFVPVERTSAVVRTLVAWSHQSLRFLEARTIHQQIVFRASYKIGASKEVARWPVIRESRCGMRGCRIGEASHPGPSARIRLEGVSQVVESLEQAVTTVDTSDDEPLVRTMTGRHVVRRVGETEHRSVFSSTRLDPFDQASKGRQVFATGSPV